MFTKQQVIKYMHAHDLVYLPIIYNETDARGMLIHLTPAGKMVDANAVNISAKTMFWGYIAYEPDVRGLMSPVRKKFE